MRLLWSNSRTLDFKKLKKYVLDYWYHSGTKMGFFWEGISHLSSKTLICWLTLINRSSITRFAHTQDCGLFCMFMESGWEVVEELTQYYQHRHWASVSMITNNITMKDLLVPWCACWSRLHSFPSACDQTCDQMFIFQVDLVRERIAVQEEVQKFISEKFPWLLLKNQASLAPKGRNCSSSCKFLA